MKNSGRGIDSEKINFNWGKKPEASFKQISFPSTIRYRHDAI